MIKIKFLEGGCFLEPLQLHVKRFFLNALGDDVPRDRLLAKSLKQACSFQYLDLEKYKLVMFLYVLACRQHTLQNVDKQPTPCSQQDGLCLLQVELL